MCFGDPVFVGFEDSVAVIHSGISPLFEFCRGEVAVEVEDPRSGHLPDALRSQFVGEDDDFGAVGDTVFFEQPCDEPYFVRVFRLVFEVLDLQNQPGCRCFPHGAEYGFERRNVLSVTESSRKDISREGGFHGKALEYPVVIGDKNAVSRQPHVEFGAVTANGVGFQERGHRVLSRSFGFPVATVGDDLGLCAFAGRLAYGGHYCAQEERQKKCTYSSVHF